MLLASWEVCIVKNCDQDLDNSEATAEGSIFKPKFTFLTIQTNPKPVNYKFIFLSKLKLPKS